MQCEKRGTDPPAGRDGAHQEARKAQAQSFITYSFRAPEIQKLEAVPGQCILVGRAYLEMGPIAGTECLFVGTQLPHKAGWKVFSAIWNILFQEIYDRLICESHQEMFIPDLRLHDVSCMCGRILNSLQKEICVIFQENTPFFLDYSPPT